MKNSLMIGDYQISEGDQFKIKGESHMYYVTGEDNLFLHLKYEDINLEWVEDKISKSAMVQYDRDERITLIKRIPVSELDKFEFHPDEHTIIELTNGKQFLVKTVPQKEETYFEWWYRARTRGGQNVSEFWKYGPLDAGILKLESRHILLKYAKY